jgi:Protein of unknown function (DUF3105)
MAKKKPRTPPPPRVQAPQRRSGPARKSTAAAAAAPDDLGLRHRVLLYVLAASGFIGLIVVVLVIALGGGGGGDPKVVAADMTAANCSFKTVTAYVPKGQGTHVSSLTKKFPWNTDPPSNGQHYPEWAVWGFYTQPVNPRMVVHNEEHGGVILWWGSKIGKSTVNKLLAFYNEQPDGSFGTPYPTLGGKIAITAWTGDPSHYQVNGYYGQGHIAICPSYTPATKTAFEAFRRLYRGHGPEGIPLSVDEPGDGPTTQ